MAVMPTIQRTGVTLIRTREIVPGWRLRVRGVQGRVPARVAPDAVVLTTVVATCAARY
jgi:hypothetical protein